MSLMTLLRKPFAPAPKVRVRLQSSPRPCWPLDHTGRMVIRDILVAARMLIAQGWIQGAFRTPDGYCLAGALIEAAPSGQRALAESAVRASIAEHDLLRGRDLFRGFAPVNTSLMTWNDRPGRTQGEVLAVLDRAIERTEGHRRGS